MATDLHSLSSWPPSCLTAHLCSYSQPYGLVGSPTVSLAALRPWTHLSRRALYLSFPLPLYLGNLPGSSVRPLTLFCWLYVQLTLQQLWLGSNFLQEWGHLGSLLWTEDQNTQQSGELFFDIGQSLSCV